MGNIPTGRRLGDRIQARTRGRIVDAAGCVTDIWIVDQSSTGVRIEAPLGVSIDRKFNLLMGSREVVAEIVWRRGFELGARFVGADEGAANARPEPAAVKKLSLDQLRGLARPGRR